MSVEFIRDLAEAVREPLIVCAAAPRPRGVLTPSRVITANQSSCALLNLELDSLVQQPLASLVAGKAGRPPPPGLVSKASLFCEGSRISVECDCRVVEHEGAPLLLFYHLTLLDWKEEHHDDDDDAVARRRRRRLRRSVGTADRTVDASTPSTAGSEVEEGAEAHATQSLADVHIERLKILLVEDDEFSVAAVKMLCERCDFDVTTVTCGEDRTGR